VSAITVRPGTAGEAEIVCSLLHELAVYEKLADKFKLTPDIVVRDFFGRDANCHCDLAFFGAVPVGVMTWYRVYASFAAARGIYLEDFFVKAERRGKGAGRALLSHLAGCAVAEGASYIGWSVLDWNESSIGFYERCGAEQIDGWLSYRLSGPALEKLAKT